METEKELRRFIHAISHDLQEPLSKILIISELVVERTAGLDETSRDYLLRMHQSALEMKKRIEELTERAASPHDPNSR